MPLTMYGSNILLDGVFGSGDPATLYVAAMHDPARYLASGDDLSEPIGGGYERVAVPNDAAHWGASADGMKANALDIIFPTATGTWGTMRYWAVTDDPTEGEVIIWGSASSRLVSEGATLRFPRDTLTFTSR